MTPSLPTDAEIAAGSAKAQALLDTMNAVLFGQQDLIEAVVTGLLARGHLLLEGLPGLGKTELVKGLSGAIGLPTKRVQFTPDLLPGDITGNPVLQEIDGRRAFVFQPGPLFAKLVLADEINRASPKTQSALLEAMQEGHVTVFGETHRPAPARSSSSPPRTRSNWRAPIRCPRPSSTASCSSSTCAAATPPPCRKSSSTARSAATRQWPR